MRFLDVPYKINYDGAGGQLESTCTGDQAVMSNFKLTLNHVLEISYDSRNKNSVFNFQKT